MRILNKTIDNKNIGFDSWSGLCEGKDRRKEGKNRGKERRKRRERKKK